MVLKFIIIGVLVNEKLAGLGRRKGNAYRDEFRVTFRRFRYMNLITMSFEFFGLKQYICRNVKIGLMVS